MLSTVVHNISAGETIWFTNVFFIYSLNSQKYQKYSKQKRVTVNQWSSFKMEISWYLSNFNSYFNKIRFRISKKWVNGYMFIIIYCSLGSCFNWLQIKNDLFFSELFQRIFYCYLFKRSTVVSEFHFFQCKYLFIYTKLLS